MKEKVKTGISLIGTAKNILDHRKFNRKINTLENHANFVSSRVNFSNFENSNLRIHLGNLMNNHNRLSSYSTNNIQKLFTIMNLQNQEINKLKNKIDELERLFTNKF
ncbi:MAG: hypothetical protein KJ771_03070 [Nanoarchaeota archaeon]|nr:hypothetical protein [Nanoarchaeota archaeon]